MHDDEKPAGEIYIAEKKPAGSVPGILREYLAMKEAVRGKRVLDILCGRGDGSAVLAETAAEVIGFDCSEDKISAAEERYGHISNLRYIHGNIADMREIADKSIDVTVMMFKSAEDGSLKSPQISFREISRVMAPGGMIISTPISLGEEIRKRNEQIARLEQQIVKKAVLLDTLQGCFEGIARNLYRSEEEKKELERGVKEDRQELNLIKSSVMFKVFQIICRFMDILLFIPRMTAEKLCAFIRMMGHVNIQELKIAWGYVKNEGITGAYRHLMKDYHQGDLKSAGVFVDEKIYSREFGSIEECDRLTFPAEDSPLVTIVIPAHNQFVYTYYCLKSILENTGDIPYEVILADDCSNDLTVDVEKAVRNIRVVRTEENLLFLKNCNHAAEQARGRYILFLNNDTQVQKNWLKPLAELCERDPRIGMAGSKLVYADGTLQEAGGIIWRDGSGWNYGRSDDAMKPEYNYVREVDYISGASVMIRTDLWKELGGFDEYFAPAYCEDSDLAFRVRRAGYKVVYQPLSVVVHFEGKSNGTDLNSGIKWYQIENSVKLKEKWEEEFSRQFENGQAVFKARERGRGKKTILVIDHYVPQYDRDAGSKTVFQYLKLFVEKGYIVKFLGDNFYQDEPYTTELQQLGIEVLYGPWYSKHWKEWLQQNKNYIDYVYLNRPHIAEKYIDFIKKNTNIKCIYYGHDLFFLRLRREYELTGNEEKRRESDEWLQKEMYVMRKADMNYYPSCVEVQEIRKIDPAVPVKAITAYVYESFRDKIPGDFSEREGILFVGGFRHPPNIDAVLWFTQEVYPKITSRQNIPLYIVGSNAAPSILKLGEKEGVVMKGFVSEEELQHLYDICRMAIVPLRYGAGVKGKVVEALYYGTPMVTTSSGIEGIEGLEDLVVVKNEANAFADAVIDLYNDVQRLQETSQAYQKFVKDRFSTEAVWRVIEEDFQ